MPIGVFDSGLGGLTVLGALRAALPAQDFIYFGDNANAPFGTRGAGEIYDLTCKGVARLFGEGCDLVILACNTASAVALRRLQEQWLPITAPERRVLGVFVPVIETLTGRPWAYDGPSAPAAVSRVALFATPATVASDAFPRELRLRASGLTVTQQACPGLVDALEAGDDAGASALVRGFCEAARALCGARGRGAGVHPLSARRIGLPRRAGAGGTADLATADRGREPRRLSPPPSPVRGGERRAPAADQRRPGAGRPGGGEISRRPRPL
jgi:hypothetical protein